MAFTPIENGDQLSDVRAKLNTGLGLADSAVQPESLGTAATTAATDYATAAQGATADTAVQPGDLGAVATSNSYSDLDGLPTIPALEPIAAYTETGATLTFVAEASGDIAIPCDGKVYQLTITGDCSLVTGAVPVAPECGSTIVYVLIDTATPPVIAIDATWNWPDATAVDLPTADTSRAELVLNTTPQGWVIARVTEIGVPA